MQCAPIVATVMTKRSYLELATISDYVSRFKYLSLGAAVGQTTFGSNRYLNESFYKSAAWLRVRDLVIVRDSGCDLGVINYPIGGMILVHHMNPLDKSDILERNPHILDPNFLITVTPLTHQAIHYGVTPICLRPVVVRGCGDTILW